MKNKKIVCYGSGMIGSGWATHFLLKGYETVVFDINTEKTEQAKEIIKNNLLFLKNENVLDDNEIENCINKLTTTTDVEKAVTDSFFIQENGPENYEIKRNIICSIEKYAPKDAIIASSTSGLLVSEIAKEAKYPERIIGAHPYNPPHLIPLVELAKGEKTSEEYLKKTFDFYVEVDKEPVILSKELPGFIANRLALALYREAVDIVEHGVCSFEEIDKACLFGPGLRYGLLGPNMIYQLGGGPHGIKGILSHIGPAVEVWWEDMAKWTKWPEGYGDRVQVGVNEAMKNRKHEQGNTSSEIAEFRDKGLVTLLKYHGKL